MIVTANNISELSSNNCFTNEQQQQQEEMVTSAFLPVPSLMKVLRKCNSFLLQGLKSVQGECQPLYACGRQIGVIRPDVACYLLEYSHVFTPTPHGFFLNQQLDSYTLRSSAIDVVLRDLRAKNILTAFRGWREECFNVWADFGTEPIFQIERSAATVLGVRAFGVHVMGYTRSPKDGSMMIWIQKRAANKPTYPGMMDTMVGGGITAGFTPSQVMKKESAEEASIPEHLSRNARSCGSVSFFAESERGLHANTEFVYEIELPEDFVPTNADGEVEGFELVTVADFISRVASSKYKLTSVPVAVDFLIRHGLINSETEAEFPALMELIHVPLHQLYLNWPKLTSSSTTDRTYNGPATDL
ncbi:unnamed protein product [Meganyctiphanes norvegica]|uniref:Nudix hydrolase domain-containing protein n=1 Tax=Meganyctiphanes norvegica TaxID=48144 RepID=A0AAV2S3X4_MEGNR